jgi:hypothetical protein
LTLHAAQFRHGLAQNPGRQVDLSFDRAKVLAHLTIRIVKNAVQEIRADFDISERLAQIVHYITQYLFRLSVF